MADELVTKDKIDVLTDHGSCEIHLSYGSVTKLSKKEEMDVLVVSAFPGGFFHHIDNNVRECIRDRKDFQPMP